MANSEDSEDDFMSDKFLVDAPAAGPSTYSQRRNVQTLQSLRRGQANNKQTLKQIEVERRREGLNTSLFDLPNAPDAPAPTQPKAVELMLKMGWKVGQGLGRKRSPSPPPQAKRPRASDDDDDDDDDAPTPPAHSRQAPQTEPLRISLWSGRKGLSARSPSPPPLPSASRHPDALDPQKLERLGQATDDFRTRQRREFEQRETENKQAKARDLVVQFDKAAGIKFHPLHILPHDPLGTVPRPLLKLLYPAQIHSPTASPAPSPPPPLPPTDPPPPERQGLFKTLTAAEKLREQMRTDMLSELGGSDDGNVRFGIPLGEEDDKPSPQKDDSGEEEDGYQGVDWADMVSGAKRVLAMDSRTHLAYLVSQLRQEHKYCFWCSFRYSSYEEMDGPGGCPGEEEDDH